MTTIEIMSLRQEPIETQQPGLCPGCVAHYVSTLDDAGAVLVYEGQDGRILVNGHHRVEAARQLGRTQVQAELVPGTFLDATRFVDLRVPGGCGH